jgi:hypothetical protein
LVAVAVALGISWATYERDIVVRQRAVAELTALTFMDDALRAGRSPRASDAAVFLSSNLLENAARQLKGATITPPSARFGDLKIVITDLHARSEIGLADVTMDLELSSVQRGLSVKITVDGDLAFRGVTAADTAKPEALASADFAISILSAEPHFKFGFLDIPARRFISQVGADGLMRALDQKLVVSAPFKDRLALDVGLNDRSVIPTPNGNVTLQTSLPSRTLEQRFTVAAPLFIRSGVWLLANAAPTGQAALRAPSTPSLPIAELKTKISELRTSIAEATREMDQNKDLVLWIKGKTLVALSEQLRSLPPANRTITFQSVDRTGQLVSDGKSYVELPNPDAATAHLVVGPPTVEWVPNKGAGVSTDLSADLKMDVHVHVNPGVGGGAGTTVGMVGSASKHASGVVSLTTGTIADHSVLLLGLTLPCDGVEAVLRTDGKLVVGPMRADMPSLGMRWTMPVPPSLGRPNVILDDLPRRIALAFPDPGIDGMAIKPAHPGMEFQAHIADAEARAEGYLVTANVEMRPTDSLALPSDIETQKNEISKGLDAVRQAANGNCHVEQHMSVLLGSLDIGPNGEIWKRIVDVFSDITQGPGDHNDLVGKDGAVPKALGNIGSDIQHGPGDHNDLVGKDGAVRSNLRNVPVIGGLF